jgi:hypothetical protein
MTVLTSDRGAHFIHSLSYKLISCLKQYTLKIRSENLALCISHWLVSWLVEDLRRTYPHLPPQRTQINIEMNRVTALREFTSFLC